MPFETPRARKAEELPGIVDDFRRAAARAHDAGFDGVEIHSANGYLLDQFLQDGTNARTDAYGGAIPNRARLLLEVEDAVAGEIGAGRIGVRISPWGSFNGMQDCDPGALFDCVSRELGLRHIAYLHVVEPRADQTSDVNALDPNAPDAATRFKAAFKGPLIAAGGLTRDTGAKLVARGAADAIAFGRLFIANPDLPERFRMDAPLNRYDHSTFYGGTERGYADYPALPAERGEAAA